MDCIFCKMVKNEIPVDKIYEDDLIMAFKDINPAAPVHILVIPKEHIPSLMDIRDSHLNLISHIFISIRTLATQLGISEEGFRVVNNCGDNGGQTVKHLHFHLLGGRNMQWPPG